MIAVDNNFLTLMLHPSARPPLDPSTGMPVSRLDERIELLIEELDEARETIIIPTPVLAEFLMLAGKDGPKYLTEINKRSLFRVEPFDERAAIELAAVELSIRRKTADKRDGAQGTWAKIKFDRQIVTIAKVNGAGKIYSDDEGVEKFARRCGISVVKTWELPLPQGTQDSFDFQGATLLTAHITDPNALVGWLKGQGHESEGQNEKESITGTKTGYPPAIGGVSTVPRLGAASSLRSEEGSGAERDEAKEE